MYIYMFRNVNIHAPGTHTVMVNARITQTYLPSLSEEENSNLKKTFSSYKKNLHVT